jgi:hypothetical protein
MGISALSFVFDWQATAKAAMVNSRTDIEILLTILFPQKRPAETTLERSDNDPKGECLKTSKK